MPRALTEHEKCRQCARLLEKGKDAVLARGIRKVSVDDIVKAAGMAKGSFYQHFASKEAFLFDLIWAIHKEFFVWAEEMVLNREGLPDREEPLKQGGLRRQEDLRAILRRVLSELFHMPEIAFFVNDSHDIDELLVSVAREELRSVNHMELEMYEKLLLMAGVDTVKVKPGVVHNYVHTLFLLMSSDLMIKEDVPETLEQIMDNLLSYVCGGVI